MKTRKIIQFCTMINEGKVNKTHPIVSAYQCKNGLAIGHPVIPDGDNFKYGSHYPVSGSKPATSTTGNTTNMQTIYAALSIATVALSPWLVNLICNLMGV